MDLYGFTPMDAVALTALVAATITDVREGKIPNLISLPLWGIGVCYWLIVGFAGLDGPWHTGLVGLLAMFPLHFLFFAIGLDKGGDAKLMIGIGALLGWWIALEATVWAILLMGPIAFLLLALRGKLGSVIAHLRYLTVDQVKKAMGWPIADKPEDPLLVIKGPVLLAAVLLARLTPWLEPLFLNETTRAWVP